FQSLDLPVESSDRLAEFGPEDLALVVLATSTVTEAGIDTVVTRTLIPAARTLSNPACQAGQAELGWSNSTSRMQGVSHGIRWRLRGEDPPSPASRSRCTRRRDPAHAPRPPGRPAGARTGRRSHRRSFCHRRDTGIP